MIDISSNNQKNFWLKNWPLFLLSLLAIVICILSNGIYFINHQLPFYTTFSFHSYDIAIVSLDIAIITFILGLLITFLLQRKSKEDSKKLQEIIEQIGSNVIIIDESTRKIQSATKNIEDASRRILFDIDDILIQATELLEKVSFDSTLFILNYTTTFGLIHTFNREVITNIANKTNSIENRQRKFEDISIDEKRNAIKMFYNDRYLKFSSSLMNGANMARECRICVCQGESLKTNFVDTFLTNMGQDKLIYWEHPDFTIIEKCEEENKEKIASLICREQERIIRGSGIAEKTLGNIEEEKIPLQMFLASYKDKKTNELIYESLVVFIGDANLGKTKIMGISSKNTDLYDGFMTMFKRISKPIFNK